MSVANAGRDVQDNLLKTQGAIQTVIQQINEMNEQFRQMANKTGADIGQLRADITKITKDTEDSKEALKFAKDGYVNKKKRLQMVGVMIIGFVFFALLLKDLGIISYMDNLFFNMIGMGETKSL